MCLAVCLLFNFFLDFSSIFYWNHHVVRYPFWVFMFFMSMYHISWFSWPVTHGTKVNEGLCSQSARGFREIIIMLARRSGDEVVEREGHYIGPTSPVNGGTFLYGYSMQTARNGWRGVELHMIMGVLIQHHLRIEWRLELLESCIVIGLSWLGWVKETPLEQWI